MTDLTPGLKELLASYHGVGGKMHVGEIAKAVSYLTRMLNHVIPFQPGYMQRRDLRRAYVEYYLPINAAKIARILDEMARYAGPFLSRDLRVLDFGSGPGTASVAFRLWGGKVSRHVLVDVVEEALAEAELLLGQTFEGSAEPPEGPFDLVFVSNVFVETENSHQIESLLELLDPGGYAIILEPATREATERLTRLRDELVEGGWRIAAPCLGIRSCPMRTQSDLWCHQDLGWSGPATIAEVDKRVGLDNARSLRYSYLVVTREGNELSEGANWRVVSNLHRRKGRAWAWLCGSGEGLWKAEALTRDRSKGIGDFFRSQRGDLLQVEGPCRGRLGPDNSVQRG